MDLEQLQRLESSKKTQYADIVSFFDENDIAKSFYAPSGIIAVERTSLPDPSTRLTLPSLIVVFQESPTPNIACWVVDATEADRGRASSAELASLISADMLKPKDKFLIIINKM